MRTARSIFNKRRSRVRFNLKRRSHDRLRLSVHRTGCHIYAQIIDDAIGRTLVSASSLERSLREEIRNGSNIAAAAVIGQLIAKRALAAGIGQVMFDRGGFLYHGRVKALANAARESGLTF